MHLPPTLSVAQFGVVIFVGLLQFQTSTAQCVLVAPDWHFYHVMQFIRQQTKHQLFVESWGLDTYHGASRAQVHLDEFPLPYGMDKRTCLWIGGARLLNITGHDDAPSIQVCFVDPEQMLNASATWRKTLTKRNPYNVCPMVELQQVNGVFSRVVLTRLALNAELTNSRYQPIWLKTRFIVCNDTAADCQPQTSSIQLHLTHGSKLSYILPELPTAAVRQWMNVFLNARDSVDEEHGCFNPWISCRPPQQLQPLYT